MKEFAVEAKSKREFQLADSVQSMYCTTFDEGALMGADGLAYVNKHSYSTLRYM